MISICFIISDIFRSINIFSTQKCSSLQSFPGKSREHGKNHNHGRLISLKHLATHVGECGK